MMDNSFNNFKEDWIKHSTDVVEIIQPNGYPKCPFARQARTNNQMQIIDGSKDLFQAIEEYTGEKDIGVIWLGDAITDTHRQIVADMRADNPHLIYFISDRIISNVIVIHNLAHFIKKRKQLMKAGNFYDPREIYPIKKTITQMMGTELQKKMFQYYCNEPGSVLDIGGNAGNLLHDNNMITKYTSLDVSKKAVQYGKSIFPDSNFFYYNKFNWMYNITGNKDEEFPDIEPHDHVFINSVFTSCDYDEMIQTLQFSYKRATKKIVFTVWNNKNINLLTMISERYSIPINDWSNNNIFYLFHDKQNDVTIERINTDNFDTEERNCSSFSSFYCIDYLKRRLEDTFDTKIEVYNPCKIDENFVTFVINIQ